MAVISKTKATLRIQGEDLIPEDITNMLGCQPTHSQEKGEALVGKNTGRKREAKFGMWRLSASAEIPGDLNAQITEIISMLSQDINCWIELSDNYDIDLFCGLFMEKGMEGIDISAKNLKALGQRHIELSLDIYGPDD